MMALTSDYSSMKPNGKGFKRMLSPSVRACNIYQKLYSRWLATPDGLKSVPKGRWLCRDCRRDEAGQMRPAPAGLGLCDNPAVRNGGS